MEAPSKVFLWFFLLPDWLKLNHLKSRTECGFSDIFSRHICSTVLQKTTFEAAEMMLGPWNQQGMLIRGWRLLSNWVTRALVNSNFQLDAGSFTLNFGYNFESLKFQFPKGDSVRFFKFQSDQFFMAQMHFFAPLIITHHVEISKVEF